MERWLARLAEGNAEAAWDLFIDRYRSLILTTIRRTLGSSEDVLDVFAEVCGALAGNDLHRLRSYAGRDVRKASFSTWLVTVVHNQTIDWLRRRDGRSRLAVPPGLSPVQQEIFEHVFARRRSHAEAYELMHASHAMSFGPFLKSVAETYRAIERTRNRGVMHYFARTQPARDDQSPDVEQRLAMAESGPRLQELLESLPADQRVALHLFVVDELPAAEVARLVGWPNAKAVYNRVYRALENLRDRLERQGISQADF